MDHLLKIWPTCRELAEDVGATSKFTVQKWLQRKRVPREYRPAVIHKARQRGFELDPATLQIVEEQK